MRGCEILDIERALARQWCFHGDATSFVMGGVEPFRRETRAESLLRLLTVDELVPKLVSRWSEVYSPGEQMLTEALGFSVSATAVQRNTETVGDPFRTTPMS